MGNSVRLGFGLTAGLFLALVVAAMVMLSLANQDYGRIMVERQAAQAASVLQAWIGGNPPGAGGPDKRDLPAELPEVMEHVLGVSLLNAQEKDLLNWGERLPAPRDLNRSHSDISEQAFGDRVYWNADGSVYYLKSQPGQQGRRQGLMNMMRGGGPLLIKYDGRSLLTGMYLRQSLILVLGAAALVLLGGMAWLFLRVQRLQASLDEQRALARLGAAARTLAHEVRNPLSIIITQKSLLERQLGPEHRPALASIGQEAQRIEFQIRQVKQALGQPDQAAAGPAQEPAFNGDPEAWLRELVDSLPAWRGRVSLAAPRGIAAQGDPSLAPAISAEALRSILVNLVDNALEAYTAGRVPQGAVTISWHSRRANARSILVVEVRDQAGGVKRVLRQRIFDPFFTTKPDGSGVGLNLARELARASGGELRYRFQRPAGSCFRVELPLCPAEVHHEN